VKTSDAAADEAAEVAAALGTCMLADLRVTVEGYRERPAALTRPNRSDPAQES